MDETKRGVRGRKHRALIISPETVAKLRELSGWVDPPARFQPARRQRGDSSRFQALWQAVEPRETGPDLPNGRSVRRRWATTTAVAAAAVPRHSRLAQWSIWLAGLSVLAMVVSLLISAGG